VELQAHGHTSDRDAPESFEQDADDVAALLAWLKVDKADFLGFSNGGTTTLQIAIRHPEIVNKIVVASANYRRDGMIPGFFESFPNATLANIPDADMQNIKAPAMIMICDQDVITREHGVKMSRIIPNAHLVVLPGMHGSLFATAEAPAKKGSKLPEITANLIEVFLNE
jgi:pimeloyl-ACP methyl ester carboxylesterase